MSRPGRAEGVYWSGDSLVIQEGPFALICRPLAPEQVPDRLREIADRLAFEIDHAWTVQGGGRQEVWLFNARGDTLPLALDSAAVDRALALVAAATPRRELVEAA